MIATGYQVSVLSKTGGRERNEDACGYWAANGSSLACYVLADGAGGHGGGDIASQLSVQTVLDRYALKPQASSESVIQLLNDANQSVMARQGLDRTLADMRSTIVILQIDSRRQLAFWGHVGDSRLYCFRNGQFECRTKDHSLVQEMLDAGLIRSGSEMTSVERNVLTGSLGGEDCFIPTASADPFPIEDRCAFLMCSDGFWSVLSEHEMEASLRNSRTPERWLLDMEQLFINKIKPGSDNYSAVAIWFDDANERTRLLNSVAATEL